MTTELTSTRDTELSWTSDQLQDTLKTLATEIVVETGRFDDRSKRAAIQYALYVGARLSDARQLCDLPNCPLPGDNPDVRFGAWVSASLADTLPQRTAYNYRALFEDMGTLDIEVLLGIGLTNCYIAIAAGPQAIAAVALVASKQMGKKLSESDVRLLLKPPSPADVESTMPDLPPELAPPPPGYQPPPVPPFMDPQRRAEQEQFDRERAAAALAANAARAAEDAQREAAKAAAKAAPAPDPVEPEPTGTEKNHTFQLRIGAMILDDGKSQADVVRSEGCMPDVIKAALHYTRGYRYAREHDNKSLTKEEFRDLKMALSPNGNPSDVIKARAFKTVMAM
jgi:hypothetical protein